MKIFITKYKDVNNSVPNYFNSPSVVVLDYVVINDNQILEHSLPSYTDEIQKREDAFIMTSSDYTMKFSLIAGIISNGNKSLEAFFDPATDNNIPVGFKICFGEDENNIERGDFIDTSSVKINDRNDDEGYILSFNVIGPQEEFIKRADIIDANPLSESSALPFRFWLSGLLHNNPNMKHLILDNKVYLQLIQRGLASDPFISWYLYNKYLAGSQKKSIWFVVSAMLQEHGMIPIIKHSDTCNPAVLDDFKVIVTFQSEGITSAPEPEILDDDDCYIGTTLDFVKPYFIIPYVSYTPADNGDVDILACAFISRNAFTIGYSNIDGHGFENDVNNLRIIYSLNRYIRNGYHFNPDNIVIKGTPRVFIKRFSSNLHFDVNVGISIGRCLVKTFQVINYPLIGQVYSDTGFNDILSATALREYKFMASGVKQSADIPVYYPLNSPHKLNVRFPYKGKNWIIKRVIDRNFDNEEARLFAIEK